MDSYVSLPPVWMRRRYIPLVRSTYNPRTPSTFFRRGIAADWGGVVLGADEATVGWVGWGFFVFWAFMFSKATGYKQGTRGFCCRGETKTPEAKHGFCWGFWGRSWRIRQELNLEPSDP